MKNKYEVRGDVTAIFINSRGKIVELIIDTDDLEKMESFTNTFCLSAGGYICGIMRVNNKRVTTRLHRLITNCPKGLDVDHINHNPLDNRKSNLRCVSRQENNCNLSGKRKKNRSGHRGVYWHERLQQWFVRVIVNGNEVFNRSFNKDQLDEAIKASNEARALHMPSSVEARTINEPNLEMYELNYDNPTRSNKTSGKRNIHWSKREQKWVVSFTVNYVQKEYGAFKELSDAMERADEVRKTKLKKSS